MRKLKTRGQQTVLLALDTETGRLIKSKELFAMDEEELRLLRRASLAGVMRSGIVEGQPRLRCALCEGPVHISMRRTEAGNRWFTHHGEVTACPYRAERRMTPEEQFAWQYQGQQEGAEHKRIKHFIADWVECEPRFQSVWRDKIRPSDLRPREWKRPDVRAVIGEREIVFEIQLSYTFLSEVLRRDDFYRKEHAHILWIFREFEPHREVVRDEFFHNRRNIFVLDPDAERETVRRGRLTLRCHYQTPTLAGGALTERWSSRYVHLHELTYPEPQYRPYYRDFDLARFRLLRLALIRSVMRWGRARRARRGEAPEEFASVRGAWRELERVAATDWPERFSEHEFLAEHLPRLLSIKYGRSIGYRYTTAWEVLNVALGIAQKTKRPYNILYLMAVRHYKPPLSPEHQKRIDDHSDEVKRSIRAGHERFLRDRCYDQAVATVLPELLPLLESHYGIPKDEETTA